MLIFLKHISVLFIKCMAAFVWSFTGAVLWPSFHVNTYHLPFTQTMSWSHYFLVHKMNGISFSVVKCHAKCISTHDADPSYTGTDRKPRNHFFPRLDDRIVRPVRKKTDFATLTIEAYWAGTDFGKSSAEDNIEPQNCGPCCSPNSNCSTGGEKLYENMCKCSAIGITKTHKSGDEGADY